MSEHHEYGQPDPPEAGADVVELHKYRPTSGPAPEPTGAPDGSGDLPEAVPDSVVGESGDSGGIESGARSGDALPDLGADRSGARSGDSGADGSALRVPVDPPGLKAPGIVDVKRHPIVPTWLRTRIGFTSTARRALEHAGYAAAFHAIRTPWYGLCLVGNAPRGGMRFASQTRRWVWDVEAAPLRLASVKAENADEYLKLSRQRDRRVRYRGLVALLACIVGLPLALALYVLAPNWLTVLAGATVLALGFYGQPVDHPVIGPAVVKTEVPKLTGPIVLRALGSIGNAKLTAAIKKGGDMDGMHFISEITRDGPGYRADLDLPYGVVPEDVMEERQSLASGLRRKLGCVWPSGDPTEHEGRLILWVGDKPMNETKKPAWPLAKDGRVDLFRPVVFGNDQRMGWVEVTLMFASVVVGSIPRMGKTFLMRLLLLIAALDPRAEVHAYDFKGTGDFRALEPVCHRYRSGEEDEDVEYVLHALRELKAELRRRAKVIKSLPSSICPESKVTSALASDKRYGLHPIVAGFDECQVPFEHETLGPEIESICTDLAKRGPALGIVTMFGTQRPDAKSLPPGISANAVLRFALKVMGHTANDMVLGTGAYKAGVRATMFARSDLGICWMSGEGDDPRIVCGSYVDAPAAEAIVTRARVMREEYGNVTGHAIGQTPQHDGPDYDVLADVLAVIPADEERVWLERIVDRLAARRPEVYGPWLALEPKAKVMQLSTALKPHGVAIKDVWGTTDDGRGTTRRGIERAAITTAITERDGKRPRS